MRRALVFFPLALFVALAGAFWLGLSRDPAVLPSALIDQPLPEFELAPVREGDAPLRRSDVVGRVALINVFASWCAPCREEHPMLMALSQRSHVPIYGLNWKESPDDCRRLLAELGDPYVRIGSDESGRLALDLGVTGAPETFLIDRHGRIRYKQVGRITPQVWRDTLAPIIARLEAEP